MKYLGSIQVDIVEARVDHLEVTCMSVNLFIKALQGAQFVE